MSANLFRNHLPARFPEMSPLLGAIVGYVVGESPTDPTIVEFTVSEQERVACIWKAGTTGFEKLQSVEDSRGNWSRLLDAGDLTVEKGMRAVRLFNVKVSEKSRAEIRDSEASEAMAARQFALSDLARFWLTPCLGSLIHETGPLPAPLRLSDIDSMAIRAGGKSIRRRCGVPVDPCLIVESKDEFDFDSREMRCPERYPLT